MLLHSVNDPRTQFQKFRRRHLYHIANQEKLTYPEGAPATLMVELLKNANVNAMKYQNLLSPDALHNNLGRAEVNVPQEPKAVTKEMMEAPGKPLEEMDLNTLKVPQLRKIAKEKGLKFEMTMKKVQLIELINGAHTAPGS